MKQIPFGRPIFGDEERNALLDVLESGTLVHGPKVKQFEQAFMQFTKAPHAVGVSSCTAALHLAYFCFGIGAGDEVIVPAQTHNATAHAVELAGAKPIFVDAEAKTGNIDIDQIEAHITPRTKAISVVHFLGMPVDMDAVNKIAQKHGLRVIEDAALAVGTYFKGVHAGLHGDVGCFSFYPVKHMTTAEGGMFTTKHAGLAEQVTRVRAFGVDRHVGERTIPGIYDVNMLGFNYRMSELHCALGVEQLKRIPLFLQKRKENYDALRSALEGITEIRMLDSTKGDFQSSYYCLSILLSSHLKERRFEIVKYLNQQGIGTSVYYPKPVPHLTYYKNKYGFEESSFPVAADISYSSIALSVGPHLNSEDMHYVSEAMKQSIMEYTI